MVLLRVLPCLSIECSGDDADENRNPENQEAVLGLVETAITLCSPPNDLIGPIAKERKRNKCNHYLSSINIRCCIVAPVVRRRGNDGAVSRSDGDVNTTGRALATYEKMPTQDSTYIVKPLRQNAHSTLGNKRIWKVCCLAISDVNCRHLDGHLYVQ